MLSLILMGEPQVDFFENRRRTFGGYMKPPGRRLLVEGTGSSALERKGFIMSKPFEIC
jgi:hypothetical protein